MSEEEDYEVEAVIGERVRNGRTEFHLKWKGYPVEDSTWEREENVNCQELINEFRNAGNHADDGLDIEIEAILGERDENGTTEFHVRFAAGGEDWITEDLIQQHRIQQYRANKGPINEPQANRTAPKRKKPTRTATKSTTTQANQPNASNLLPPKRKQPIRSATKSTTTQANQPKASNLLPTKRTQPTRSATKSTTTQANQPKASNLLPTKRTQPTRSATKSTTTQANQPKASNLLPTKRTQPTRSATKSTTTQANQPNASNLLPTKRTQPTQSATKRSAPDTDRMPPKGKKSKQKRQKVEKKKDDNEKEDDIVEDDQPEKDFFSIGNDGEKSELTSIYRCLKPIIKDGPHKEDILAAITRRVITVTRMAYHGSTVALFECKKALQEENFAFFSDLKNIRDCFLHVSVGKDVWGNVIDYAQYLHDDIRGCFAEFDIEPTSTESLGNVKTYAVNQYITNFANNIRMHYKPRLKTFFLAHTRRNPLLFPGVTPQVVHDTVTYMTNRLARGVEPNINLIHAIPNWNQFGITDEYILENQGFFENRLLGTGQDERWFGAVILFLGMQMEVDDYQTMSKAHPELNLQPLKNFVVVPLHSFKRQHIRIDNDGLYWLLRELKLLPETPGKVLKEREEFKRRYKTHWYNWFDQKKIEKMEKGGKKFHFQISTNGLGVSVLFDNQNQQSSKKPDNYIETLRQKFDSGHYKRAIGIDPGYKVWISAVIRYLRSNDEFNYEVTSRQFHKFTKKKNREKKAKRLTGEFENRRKADAENREVYPVTPSPNRREDWFDYIDWRFKWSNEGFDVYTDIRYARLDLDKYFRTQKVMDRMVNELVGKDPALVCIGSANFSPSAPIKGYVRCPGTKMILQYLKKKKNVDVLLIDEYNTSQVCGHCHKFFHEIKQKMTKRRYLQCRETHCQIRFHNAIGHTNAIVAKKNHRKFQKDSRAFPNGPNPKNVRHVKSNNWEWVLPQRNQKLTWNRDISAARNILYKGICAVMDIPIDITLDRLRRAEHQALRPMPIADDLISGLLRAFHITPPPPQRQAQNVQQGGEQVDEWNDNQQNDTPNDQQANVQNIDVENNAQNEAQVDRQNQQHVPENVQQNYFYMHW